MSRWSWAAFLAALAVAWASAQSVQPSLDRGEMPAGSFSVERALAEIEAIAQAPRPLGKPAHGVAREHLLSRLRDLGLRPEVEEATVTEPLGRGGVLVTRVRNVVARKDGTGSGRLTLASHYDSQPQTPGAGDAASGVATILECLRALGRDWAPVPELEVVFTDAEELGLMGARARVARRAPRTPDLLLNFEARGQRGPVAMFETSDANEALLRLFADSAPRPFASSLSYEVYRRMPNDTDFTIFREAGVRGLNFAFISGHPAYHSRLDTPERLSAATLQQEGVNALAVIRALGAGVEPTGSSGDAVFFNPWGTSFLLYPASWAWPLCLAILVAVGALWVLLDLRLRVRRGAALAAAGLWAVSVAAAVPVGWLFSRALRSSPELLRSPYREPYDFRAFVVILALLVGAAVLALWALRGRRSSAAEVLAGSLLFWAALLVLLTWALPGASYLAAWPIGFLGLGAVIASLVPQKPVVTVVVLSIAAWPGLAVWAPVCDLVFQALGFGAAPLLAPTLALGWSLLAVPLWALVRHRRWMPAAVLTAVALAWAGALVLRDEPSPERPGVDTLAWLQETDGSARWFSLDDEPDDWTGEVVHRRQELPAALRLGRDVLSGPAKSLGLPAPRVAVEEDETRAGNRHLLLRLRSERGAPVLRAFLRSDAPLTSLQVDGAPVEASALTEEGVYLALYGFEGGAVLVDVEMDGAGSLDVELIDQSWGLPAGLLSRPRPADRIPRPGWLTDSTFTVARKPL